MREKRGMFLGDEKQAMDVAINVLAYREAQRIHVADLIRRMNEEGTE